MPKTAKHRLKKARNEHIAQSEDIIAISSSMYTKRCLPAHWFLFFFFLLFESLHVLGTITM